MQRVRRPQAGVQEAGVQDDQKPVFKMTGKCVVITMLARYKG